MNFSLYCTILEVVGLANFGRFSSPLLNKLQQIYVGLAYTVVYVYLACHAFNTFSRAINYPLEFVQCLFEDVVLNTIVWIWINLLTVSNETFLYMVILIMFYFFIRRSAH